MSLVDKVSRSWNNGDNHLSASGRCLIFRTSAIKKFRLPRGVVNGDMFLYLENKKNHGKFRQIQDAIVRLRCPQQLKDQIGPSSRYLYSRNELTDYFDFDIDKEYQIPKLILIRAYFEMFNHPVQALSYLGLYAYTRIFRQKYKEVVNPVWKVDTSTKNLNSFIS